MHSSTTVPTGGNYKSHLATKLAIYVEGMEIAGLDQLIIGSGSHNQRFLDDCFIPYFANPYFEEFLSLPDRPDSFIVLKPGCRPELHVKRHDDFWHSEPRALESSVTDNFQLFDYRNKPDFIGTVGTAYLGPYDSNANRDALLGSTRNLNPSALINHIDYHRAWKTEYEKECLRQASSQAAAAHIVAENCFRQGMSEYEIHMAYLGELGCREHELPYDNIIAINEHSAVLHHMHLCNQRPERPKSFLIDAGARYQGYAADVSRTYAFSSDDSDFAGLIQAVDNLQQVVSDSARPGETFLAVHRRSNKLIAGALAESGILEISAEEALEKGVVNAFFPHGIGHLLGVQVHDKGGHMAGPDGSEDKPPRDHPSLRLTRAIEEDMCFTIEPGIYFIPQLLSFWRGTGFINETLVDKLIPFGGIRIEDNVIATKGAPENLTRTAFNSLSSETAVENTL